jgi:hypothetical protein
MRQGNVPRVDEGPGGVCWPPNGCELSRSAEAGKTSLQYGPGLQPNQDATSASPPSRLERVVRRLRSAHLSTRH